MAASGTSVVRILGDGRVTRVKQSHELEVQKMLAWLRAKLHRTIMLWSAAIAEVRLCYGAGC